MAVSWISALKLVPWGDVIEATPQVLKAAKGLLGKKDSGGTLSSSTSSGHANGMPPVSEHEQIVQLQARLARMEQAHQQSLQIIETLAEQNQQIVNTVDLLRTGAQRLAWACSVLAACVVGLLIHALR
jgi:TolA-binding protein